VAVRRDADAWRGGRGVVRGSVRRRHVAGAVRPSSHESGCAVHPLRRLLHLERAVRSSAGGEPRRRAIQDDWCRAAGPVAPSPLACPATSPAAAGGCSPGRLPSGRVRLRAGTRWRRYGYQCRRGIVPPADRRPLPAPPPTCAPIPQSAGSGVPLRVQPVGLAELPGPLEARPARSGGCHARARTRHRGPADSNGSCCPCSPGSRPKRGHSPATAPEQQPWRRTRISTRGGAGAGPCRVPIRGRDRRGRVAV